MTEKNRIRGKKARAAGQRFEVKVRNDLESKGFVVDKWSNNVEFEKCEWEENKELGIKKGTKQILTNYGKLIKVKNKFRGPGIPMMLGAGLPDFIAYSNRYVLMPYLELLKPIFKTEKLYIIFGVECKTNGYLDKIEKEKCAWLIKNNIFSKILIASKGEKRGTIKYVEFGEKK